MDFGTIIIAGLLSFLFIKYIDQYLELPTLHPSISKIFKISPLGVLIYQFIKENLSINLPDTEFLFIGFVCFFLYKIKETRNVKNVFWLIVPYFAFKLISVISNLLGYQKDQDLNDGLTAFLVCWLIGFGIYLQKQNKKDKIQKAKDEAEKRILEETKKSLESLVDLRTAEISQQKIALEESMVELKAAQNQLIQAEKMASLGELTAGIAHEIQNPLNFVNNFAELNTELLEELREEQKKEVRDIENENQIIGDIFDNMQKIIHHGKRADGIIKGMLQHSRKSTGQKEIVDLNNLADEYLRLSFHGLRAKDKSFNANMKTSFDPKVSKVNAIPQDLGRVFLNIITNAFYVVNEKKLNLIKENGSTTYEPTVTVTTEKKEDEIVIKISDNGSGIPDAIRDKIFQPFFTTKPTGQGTGLGLSLSYDIITKGHNGNIEIESEEDKGTTFIITIPQ